jgi:peptidoglycan/LPS O-acetylase OafA/YrhL
MSSEQTPHLTFRPDIQGIRALAVLLVIVHHLGGHGISGGFIGVDVFFVVSGFLITGLLAREVDHSGRVSLVAFYARRARRILPAATVVTLGTVLASTLFLAALRTQTVITDAIWATLFAANVRFAMVGTDYFAQGEPPSPLQHYWSLSVEEQFYLAWPLIMLGCAAWGLRRGRGAGRRLAVTVLGVLVVASLAWSIWATYHSPTTAYFSTFARAWELGVGAGCALLLNSGRWRPPAAVTAVLPWLGLGAIGLAALWLTPSTPFPGVVAARPVLGTAALILAGGHGRTTPVGRLLSSGPAVRVGDWSYSLYLWHWPVIIVLRSHVGPHRFGSLLFQVAALAFIFVLSWATYRWVETPFRTGQRWRRPSRALAIFPVCLALVAVGLVASDQTLRYRLGEYGNEPAISTADYPSGKLAHDSYVALVEASALAARDGRAVPSRLQPRLLGLRQQTASLGDCDYRTGTRKLCPIGDTSADRTIVVFGDSHARALSPAVEALGEKYGYRVYVLVYSGCMVNALEQIDRLTGRPWGACEEFKAWARETIASMHPDYVLVSTSYGRFVDPDTGEATGPGGSFDDYLGTLRTGFREEFAGLEPDAGAVYVVGNTPKLPRETGVCLSQGDPDLGDCAFEPEPRASRVAKASFAAAREAGVGVVDAHKWFCAGGVCPSVVGNFITMRDSEHMTPDYARWLATPLARTLGIAGSG